MDPGDRPNVAALFEMSLAPDGEREGERHVNYVVRRGPVAEEKEVATAAYFLWQSRGSHNRDEEGQRTEWNEARRALEEEVFGYARVLHGRHFLAILDIFATSTEAYETLARHIVNTMRRLNSGNAAPIRAVVACNLHPEAVKALDGQRWCSLTVMEGGKVHFFPHDRA